MTHRHPDPPPTGLGSRLSRARDLPRRESSILRREETELFRHRPSREERTQLGATLAERSVGLSPQDRKNHTHVIGSTGTGKSKLLEYLIRQDCQNRKVGVCLIDPHGTLYTDLVRYLSHRAPRLADRVVLFNPAGDLDQVVGFNPIPGDLSTLDYTLDMLIAACLKAWGQDTTDRTPRITRWLENIFYPLLVNGLTLVESLPLLDIHNSDGRHALLQTITSDAVLADWQMFESSNQTQRQNLLEGAGNRLRKFLRNDILRAILGQTERRLDFGSLMAEGQILLINLAGGGRISAENAQLLGVMIVNELFRVAKLRDPTDPTLKPFYLYIDEFGQFITRDIARALEECRKYQLFLTLAHQHLAQLKKEDEYLYASVMTNCKNKIVFGGLSYEDAQVMTDDLMTGFLDLQAVKDERYATRVRHVEETRRVRGRTHATTTGASASATQGTSVSHGETKGEAHSQGQGRTATTGTSATAGASDTYGRSQGDSHTRGRSDALGVTQGESHSASRTDTAGTTRSESRQHSEGGSLSQTAGTADSGSQAHTDGRTHSLTLGQNDSDNWSRGQSQQWGETDNRGQGQSIPLSGEQSVLNQNQVHGENYGGSVSANESGGHSESAAMTRGDSHSDTHGRSHSTSASQTTGHSWNTAEGRSFAETESHSLGQSATTSRAETRTHTANESDSRSQSVSEQHSRSQSHTASRAEARSEQTTATQSHHRSQTRGETQSRTQGASHSESHGESESEVPFLKPEEYQELSSRTYWTLAELRYLALAEIKNQGVAQAFIKIGHQRPLPITIDPVAPVPWSPTLSPKRLDQFTQRVIAAHPDCYTGAAQARLAYQQRQISIFGAPLRFDERPVGLLLEGDCQAEPAAEDPFGD